MPLALNHVAVAAVLLWAGSGSGFADPGETSPIRPSSSKEYAEQARSHLTNGDFSRAIDVCRTGLEADSTSKVLLNLLAAAYAGEGRYAPAIQALERVVQLAPGSVLTYLNLGGIHTKLGQYDAAERYLSRASVLAPSQPEIRRRLAEVYLGTNRYGEAAEQIEHALRLFPGRRHSLLLPGPLPRGWWKGPGCPGSLRERLPAGHRFYRSRLPNGPVGEKAW